MTKLKAFRIVTLIACAWLILSGVSYFLDFVARIKGFNIISILNSITNSTLTIGFGFSIAFQILSEITIKFHKGLKYLIYVVGVCGVLQLLYKLYIIILNIITKNPDSTLLLEVANYSASILHISFLCCIILYCIFYLRYISKYNNILKYVSITIISLRLLYSICSVLISYNMQQPDVYFSTVLYINNIFIINITYIIAFLYGFRNKELLKNEA